ncbi:MAG TPA: DinB family protein [Pyrinomonadaceae bacterium]|nr:DinB family protein [Pyrinomonadaceae bacterium]
MSINGLIKRQLSQSHDSNGWFVCVKNALDGVDVELACWKPVDADVNCIWEIVAHLTYYNYAYVQRFKGIDFQYDVSSNNQTFSVGEYDESSWQVEIARYDAVMNEFRELVDGADESKFAEPVSADNQTKWATLILNIAAHNAYHAGQIMLIRRLRGAWDLANGVS